MASLMSLPDQALGRMRADGSADAEGSSMWNRLHKFWNNDGGAQTLVAASTYFCQWWSSGESGHLSLDHVFGCPCCNKTTMMLWQSMFYPCLLIILQCATTTVLIVQEGFHLYYDNAVNNGPLDFSYHMWRYPERYCTGLAQTLSCAGSLR